MAAVARPVGVAGLCHGVCMDEEGLWDAYDRMGLSFRQHAADSAYNAHYDRPAVLAALGPVAGRRVLDAACGPGLYLRALLDRGAEVTAFDASPVMVSLARQQTAGRVRVDPVPATSTRVEALREKACALLGAWAAACPPSEQVAVGDLGLEASLLVATPALEIAVHGWDVGQATGERSRIPRDLARGLLPVAHEVIGPLDRGPRFARPRPARRGAAYDERLLAWTGRGVAHMTEPLRCTPAEPAPREGAAP